MVCLSEGEVIQSRIYPCGIHGERVTLYSVLYTKDQWIHGRCSKLKKVIASTARFVVCSKCDKETNGEGEVQPEVMCDEVETLLSWQ